MAYYIMPLALAAGKARRRRDGDGASSADGKDWLRTACPEEQMRGRPGKEEKAVQLLEPAKFEQCCRDSSVTAKRRGSVPSVEDEDWLWREMLSLALY